jgi:hypothetical protein
MPDATWPPSPLSRQSDFPQLHNFFFLAQVPSFFKTAINVMGSDPKHYGKGTGNGAATLNLMAQD